MFFINGLGFGTTTVAIPQLKMEANSTSAVSDEMASWICKSFKIFGVFFMDLVPRTV